MVRLYISYEYTKVDHMLDLNCLFYDESHRCLKTAFFFKFLMSPIQILLCLEAILWRCKVLFLEISTCRDNAIL